MASSEWRRAGAKELTGIRARLLARRTELGGQISALGEELSSGAEDAVTEVEDIGDQGERETRESVRHAEQRRDAEEFEQIEKALARMDDGSFGRCVDCSAEIPAARLEAQPWAARCLECQEIRERKGLNA